MIKEYIPYRIKATIRMFPEFLRALILVPRLPKLVDIPTLVIGTPYGGKHVAPLESLHNSKIISGGCGEDISFDVEYASKYNATVIMVEPIPRAINHVNKVIERSGRASYTSYSDTGTQPLDSYDLSKVTTGQLRLIPKALWNSETELELFQPKESEHISHSVIDLQKTAGEKKSIPVKSTTVKRILENEGMEKLEILKLDIEGAQLEVIKDCFEHSIFPRQIIVEIDELYFPTWAGRKRAKDLLKLLRKHNYVLIGKLNKYDFTFLHTHLSSLP